MTNVCTILFFSKNCANTESHSFADIYAVRILDKGNYHSSPALLQLVLVPSKHQFPLATGTECVEMEILIYPQNFGTPAKLSKIAELAKLSLGKDYVSLTFIKSKIK